MSESEFQTGIITDEPDGLPQQFTVMMKNRAGSLSSLVNLLRSNRVDVLGFSVKDSRDATMVRLVVSDCDVTQRVFFEKGIQHTVSELVVVAMRDVQEDLGKILGILRAAETNIDFAYALLPNPAGYSLMAMHLEDAIFGISVLEKSGIKVMWQKDLMR